MVIESAMVTVIGRTYLGAYLKPDNVFLVPDPDGGIDRTKVLDFGIAKLADSSMTSGRRTQTGILMGTPLYMAPEQARAAGMIDPRADLYSLGCIIYHMLVGRPPFVADGAGEIIALQMFGVVEPPSRLVPVAPVMEQIVLRLLEKEPAARFDSAAEVVAALARFDTAMTNRPTWPSGQAAVMAMDDVTGEGATLSSSDDLRTGDEAALGGAPSKRTAMPELRMVDGVRPAVAPGKRSTMRVVAGGVAITALAAMLAYTLLSDSGGAPANVESVVAPAPSAAPTAAPPPAAAPPLPPAAPAALPDPAPPDSVSGVMPVTTPATVPAELHETADKHGRHVHRAKPGQVSMKPTQETVKRARPGDLDVPDKAIEVIRDIRQVDPPKLGAHTSKGSPIETNIELGKKKDPTTP
jgi:serine/threonine-protein kinase